MEILLLEIYLYCLCWQLFILFTLYAYYVDNIA